MDTSVTVHPLTLLSVGNCQYRRQLLDSRSVTGILFGTRTGCGKFEVHDAGETLWTNERSIDVEYLFQQINLHATINPSHDFLGLFVAHEPGFEQHDPSNLAAEVAELAAACKQVLDSECGAALIGVFESGRSYRLRFFLDSQEIEQQHIVCLFSKLEKVVWESLEAQLTYSGANIESFSPYPAQSKAVLRYYHLLSGISQALDRESVNPGSIPAPLLSRISTTLQLLNRGDTLQLAKKKAEREMDECTLTDRLLVSLIQSDANFL